MPKNYGKKIKVYQYVPLLDDRNVNDQGLDASGATIADGNLYGARRGASHGQGRESGKAPGKSGVSAGVGRPIAR